MDCGRMDDRGFSEAALGAFDIAGCAFHTELLLRGNVDRPHQHEDAAEGVPWRERLRRLVQDVRGSVLS